MSWESENDPLEAMPRDSINRIPVRRTARPISSKQKINISRPDPGFRIEITTRKYNIMKAFLSHSSVDKEFVRKVSYELGRQYCVFDEQAFANGMEFKDSINKGLDESCVFVLFATRTALKSLWVNFEIQEACYRTIHRHMEGALVYQLEPDIQYSDYPEWLRRAKIKSEVTPKIIARDIRQRLEESLRERQQHIYVPRTQETDLLTTAITSLGEETPNRVIMVSGLPGVGRKTLVRRVVPALLNFQRTIEIPISSGDTLHDIAIKFADKSEPYSTPQGLEQIVMQIRLQGLEDAQKRIINNIQTLQNAGELLVLIDDGGMLTEDGSLREHILSIIRTISTHPDLYCILILKRIPQLPVDVAIPRIPVSPLSQDNTKKLLSLAGRQIGLSLSPKTIDEFSIFVAGYPPAAFYAINQSKVYGIEVVLNDKRNLVEFRSAVFLKHFTNLQLKERERTLIQLLSAFSPLPFKVVAIILNENAELTSKLLTRLIDLSLIYVDESGFYRISDPISSAVDRVLGFPNPAMSLAVAEALDRHVDEIGSDNNASGLLDLMRVSFRASKWSGREQRASALISLTSDINRLVENFFHAKHYEKAVEFARLSIEQGAKDADIYYYLIRSLINLEKWGEVPAWIGDYTKIAPKRDVDYLLGYQARKKGEIKNAIRLFKDAEAGGRRGAGLGRELALCYMLDNNHSESKKYLDAALSLDSDNRFLVDLGIQLATVTGNEMDARKNLDRLKLIDNESFYLHRLSRVELAFGHTINALQAAKDSYRLNKPPAFSILAQLIVCEIEMSHITQAETYLAELDQSYKGRYGDVKSGLHCKFELAKGNYNEALGWLEKSHNRKLPVYLSMKLDALKGLLKKSALTDEQRAAYQSQIALLEKETAMVSKAAITFF